MEEEENGGNGGNWLSAPSSILKKPFSIPSKQNTSPSNNQDNDNDNGMDIEGWTSLYNTNYCKPIQYKERNRFHTGLMKEAEEAKDTEKPDLLLSSIQNAIAVKRMRTKRILMGSMFKKN